MVCCQEVDVVEHAFGGGQVRAQNDGSGERSNPRGGKQSLDDAKNRAAQIESILVKSEYDRKKGII